MATKAQAHAKTHESGGSAAGMVLKLPDFQQLGDISGASNLPNIKLAYPSNNPVADVSVLTKFLDDLGVPADLRPTLEDVFSYAAREAATRRALPATAALKAALAAAFALEDRELECAASPSALDTRLRRSSAELDKEASNIDNVRAARRLLSTYHRRKHDIVLTDIETEEVRAARRLVKAFDRRSSRSKIAP